jgi:2-(1,2-epoxy-1,2-dihydrophenyl)acetyl-CoA isomerase
VNAATANRVKPAEPQAPAYETLELTARDGVGVLTLMRPTAGNAMCPTMLRELPEATAWLADQAALRALVITGEGAAFSSGGDLQILSGLATQRGFDIAADSRRRIDQLHQAILNLRRIEYPVVAAVNGLAAGSGFALALACDQRIASTRAVFTAAYGRVGLTPDGGLTYLLPRLVGEVRALAILIGDDIIRAPEAAKLGLVDAVVEPEVLLDTALGRARRLATLAPRYTATLKRLLGESFHHTLAEHLQRERHAFAEASASKDFIRGADAVLAGKRPCFRGE